MGWADVLAFFAVGGADHVLALWKVPAAHLIHLRSAIGAEHHAGQGRHIAHRRNPASAVTDALYDVISLLVDDSFVCILENLPFGRVVLKLLFLLV